ncbi:hypothetical protein GCM10023196_042330 [Actinoallomurus vinaceus]|uniref:PucR C-terminal helix-turn-helix domain-containing protein n=1 Tax=Actinoallomurus vinaceus TaxID=1080074 RepID=A0ABP8UE30_9ACTN
MPTLSALVRSIGLRLLAEGDGERQDVGSAVILPEAGSADWPDTGTGLFEGVLVIVPNPYEDSRDHTETILRRLGDAGAAGLVLAGGTARASAPDLPGLAGGPAGADAPDLPNLAGGPAAAGDADLPNLAGGPAGAGDAGLSGLVDLAARHRLPLLTSPMAPAQVWAAVTTALREDRESAAGHARDLHEMQRAATRADGVERLLRWLTRRIGASVVLVDRTGRPRHAFPTGSDGVLDRVTEEIERVMTGAARAVAADLDKGVVHVQSIGEGDTGAVLVVARERRLSPPERRLVGDASRLLGLRWRADDADRRRRRLDRAETYTREAVLHLLMVGDLQAARRVAGTLGPPLAETIRVFVLECAAETRDRSVAYCDRVSEGRAWIVRCPVYRRHVIVIAPADDGPDVLDDALRVFAGRTGGVDIGGSEPVALGDLASGYAQAFHALAVARGSAGHYARFSPRGDLAALLRPRAWGWAQATLEPLSRYRPDRGQDPDAAELTATLRSWLDFYGGAARQLKIHRNTLAARLRHIERLLGYRLDDVGTQARMQLALRVLDGPGGGDPAPLDVLLDDPEVRRWADLQIAPLLRRDQDLLVKTLRVWLDNDARVEAAAAALGLSAPGMRKRLIRVEEILGRSLVSGPSARYDLWFALTVHGG